MRRRAWFLYLFAGVATLMAYLLVPGMRQGWLFNLIALSSPVAIVIAARTLPPEDATPWYLFALGQAFFVAGDVITYNYETFFMRTAPFPSAADAMYLSVYPCLIAGILELVRRRSPGRDRDSVIDSLMVAIGVGVISWAFLMAPTAQDANASLLQKLVSVSYPFMDLFLLTALVRLVIGPGRRGMAFYLLPAAGLCLFLTDFANSYLSVRGLTYDHSGYLEIGSGLFYLLWGAAALHGSQRHLAERGPDQEVRVTRMRLALLGAALLIPLAVREVQQLRGHDSDLWMISISTGCLFVLAMSRMSGLVDSLKLSFGRERALRGAAASLVTATNRDEIHAATMGAVDTLVPQGSVRLLVRGETEDDQRFAIVAASERTGGAPGHARRRLRGRAARRRAAHEPGHPATDARARGRRRPSARDVRAGVAAGRPGRAERPAGDRHRRGAAANRGRRARDPCLPGLAGARERGPHRGRAPAAERGAVRVARPALLRRRDGRRRRLADPLRQPVRRAHPRLPARASSSARGWSTACIPTTGRACCSS